MKSKLRFSIRKRRRDYRWQAHSSELWNFIAPHNITKNDWDDMTVVGGATTMATPAVLHVRGRRKKRSSSSTIRNLLRRLEYEYADERPVALLAL